MCRAQEVSRRHARSREQRIFGQQRNDLKIESKNHVPVRLFGKVPRVFLVRDRAVLGVRFDVRERHGGGGWVRSVGWEVREGGTRGVELLWRKKKQKVPRCV
jgi:hypothetical protein